MILTEHIVSSCVKHVKPFDSGTTYATCTQSQAENDGVFCAWQWHHRFQIELTATLCASRGVDVSVTSGNLPHLLFQLKVMKFQDELELGQRERKHGLTIPEQVAQYREKLVERVTTRDDVCAYFETGIFWSRPFVFGQELEKDEKQKKVGRDSDRKKERKRYDHQYNVRARAVEPGLKYQVPAPAPGI